MAATPIQHHIARYGLALLFVAGCGTDPASPSVTPDAATDARTVDAPATADSGPADAAQTPDASTADAAPPPDVMEPPLMAGSCDMVHAGTVTGFMVDGADRSFIITLPNGADAPGGHWPVVFNWHGLGDTAANFNGLLAGQANNTSMPFILVTPESTHLGPTTQPPGLDWDELMVMTPNREARLFDAVVGCLDTRFGVDRDRVYTVGFSAGAIMSDLLAVLRGDQLAAVVSFSGGYFADEANPATLGALRSFVAWPDLTTRNAYPQLMLHGGMTDTFSLVVATARFNVFAENDSAWLRARGHDVIVCDHGGGHRVPAGVMGRQVVEFLAAHRRGMASTWGAGLPADYPAYCAFQAHGTM
jgi:predicted esterase